LINGMLAGNNDAANRALEHLLPSLRAEARKRLKGESRRHDLETDVLVGTAVRRVIRPERPLHVNDRNHFSSLLKLKMNHKLSERGRRSDSHLQETEVKDHHLPCQPESQFVAHGTLEGVLVRLRAMDPLRYQIVIRRDVHDESWPDIAKTLELTEATVKYRYQAAYAWLRSELGADATKK
jgi:DNA-directed RNA polymerase specialized sigma24 family protein